MIDTSLWPRVETRVDGRWRLVALVKSIAMAKRVAAQFSGADRCRVVIPTGADHG